MRALLIPSLLRALCLTAMVAHAQTTPSVDVRMRLAFHEHPGSHPLTPAVIWLEPVQQAPPAPFLPQHRYTLLQKNRMFTPHLLVIPVGSVVQFPNADPFFHNVFSLFDGRRFDLGLYEAGSTKAVTFSREGVSYIFCNIHPEMSAVIVTLSTHLFAVADAKGAFQIADVPVGDYDLYVWIEGVAQPALAKLIRRVHLSTSAGDLGSLSLPSVRIDPTDHPNMYGQPYDKDVKRTY
jgi:hypothetical protein